MCVSNPVILTSCIENMVIYILSSRILYAHFVLEETEVHLHLIIVEQGFIHYGFDLMFILVYSVHTEGKYGYIHRSYNLQFCSLVETHLKSINL
jgi:hypothetical protein